MTSVRTFYAPLSICVNKVVLRKKMSPSVSASPNLLSQSLSTTTRTLASTLFSATPWQSMLVSTCARMTRTRSQQDGHRSHKQHTRQP
nr:MAG TPA: hypothetical protein [Caudoviricetes sp.]